MIKIKKYAAIDIGSNAMRLLITNIIEEKKKETIFNKNTLVRVPIRLGQDAFTTGIISDENINRMVDAMKAYKLLMGVYKVDLYMACATSAMRDAANGKEVANLIEKESGIKISIIDGEKEASIIASSYLKPFINSSNAVLYVDVGGGSTEFTLFSEGKTVASKSFKNGTVRLINNSVPKSVWSDIKKWIKNLVKDHEDILLIGSGGNINKVFKMSGKSQDKFLDLAYLKNQYETLKSLSYDERISVLGLNPDRADVIVPALDIYIKAMEWSGSDKIYVPKIGLADGVVKTIYNETVPLDYQKI